MHLRCIRLWMITMAYRGFGDACFYFSNDSALSGIRRAFDYWSKAPDTWDILPERVSEQCFCQDTVQTYSSSTMQFTGACHRENTKSRYFLVSEGPWFIHSPSWSYVNGSYFEHPLIQSTTYARLYTTVSSLTVPYLRKHPSIGIRV